MASKLFKEIMTGMEQAIAYSEGKTDGCRVRHIKVPKIDVATVRDKTGLSQQKFADSIGVSVGTLRGWEYGRREPQGPARVLLALIADDPELVMERLGR